jgi:hypothetical protein
MDGYSLFPNSYGAHRLHLAWQLFYSVFFLHFLVLTKVKVRIGSLLNKLHEISVQDKFFFGGGHDEASIPYQGVEGAAVDPQVIGGQYSLAVSVATHATIATSVVATRSFFGAFCQTMAEINAGQVMSPRGGY